jgi:hypothetical protein
MFYHHQTKNIKPKFDFDFHGETIDTFIFITGVSEPIALQKIEIIGVSMNKTSPSPPSSRLSFLEKA